MADFCFVDTSALGKRYIMETGSLWLRSLLAPATGNKVVIVRTTVVEMIAAISRREREARSLPLTQRRRGLIFAPTSWASTRW